MLKGDPEKHRQWQERSRRKALERLQEKGRKLTSGPEQVSVMPVPAKVRTKPVKRLDDGPWRRACILARGEICRSCGDTAHVEMDHVIPKSQDATARADVENGLPLCGAFSRNTPGGCHPAKTAGTLLFDAEWFDPDQIEYLAAKGWVAWDSSGQPYGRGWKHFLPRSVEGR